MPCVSLAPWWLVLLPTCAASFFSAKSLHVLKPIDAARFPARRLLSVHLLTPPIVPEYSGNLPSFCYNFYARNANHSVYLPVPTQHFRAVATSLTGTAPPLGASLVRWRHGMKDCASTQIYLHALSIEVPAKYQHLNATCDGRPWSQDYALYSGAFFVSQLLWQPLLKRAAYYVKMDTCGQLSANEPTSLSLAMAPWMTCSAL